MSQHSHTSKRGSFHGGRGNYRGNYYGGRGQGNNHNGPNRNQGHRGGFHSGHSSAGRGRGQGSFTPANDRLQRLRQQLATERVEEEPAKERVDEELTKDVSIQTDWHIDLKYGRIEIEDPETKDFGTQTEDPFLIKLLEGSEETDSETEIFIALPDTPPVSPTESHPTPTDSPLIDIQTEVSMLYNELSINSHGDLGPFQWSPSPPIKSPTMVPTVVPTPEARELLIDFS